MQREARPRVRVRPRPRGSPLCRPLRGMTLACASRTASSSSPGLPAGSAGPSRSPARAKAPTSSSPRRPRSPTTRASPARSTTSPRGRGARPQRAAVKLDVRDDDGVRGRGRHGIEHFGRVDALVNNAGALWWADVAETPVKKFDLIMGINVRASFVLAHAVLPHMIEAALGPHRHDVAAGRADRGRAPRRLRGLEVRHDDDRARDRRGGGGVQRHRPRALAGDRDRELRDHQLRPRRPGALAQGRHPRRRDPRAARRASRRRGWARPGSTRRSSARRASRTSRSTSASPGVEPPHFPFSALPRATEAKKMES